MFVEDTFEAFDEALLDNVMLMGDDEEGAESEGEEKEGDDE